MALAAMTYNAAQGVAACTRPTDCDIKAPSPMCMNPARPAARLWQFLPRLRTFLSPQSTGESGPSKRWFPIQVVEHDQTDDEYPHPQRGNPQQHRNSGGAIIHRGRQYTRWIAPGVAAHAR